MPHSPAVILYDATGTAMAVENGVAIPVGTRALLAAGSDGVNSRILQTTTSGALRIQADQLPAALVGGRLDENLGAWLGSTAPTVGQKVMAESVPVTFASNQSTIQVSIAALAGAVTGIVAGTITLGGGTANTLNVIRATAYTEPTVNAQRSISSASASDTAAGVGARTVRIDYRTSAGVSLSEVVVLNGVTPVNTVSTTICYIEKIIVLTVGSTGRNVGVITLFAATGGGGGTVGTIGVGNLVAAQGDSITLWAHHYVPVGKTASFATYIVSAISGGSSTNAVFLLRSAPLPIGVNAEVVVSDIILAVGPLVRALSIPIKLVGPAKIVAYGIPGVNNAKLNASFDFAEVDT